MAVFSDIELEWGDRVFTIKAHKVMGAIARIEDVITFPELQNYAARGTAPVGKLAMAYGAVLRYAGAAVKDDEVYERAFSENPESGVMAAVMRIMMLMLPASARAKLDDAGDADVSENEGDLGNSPATAPASSRKPTKQRSRKAG
jgi:hypothetical protein